MSELLGVEICLFPLTRLIAYTTACCYRTSRDFFSPAWLRNFVAGCCLAVSTFHGELRSGFAGSIWLYAESQETTSGDWWLLIDKVKSMIIIMAHFYRAMHFSAKRGIVIACRLSVCLSLRLSVTLVNCDHIGWNSSKIISPLVSLGRSPSPQNGGSIPRMAISLQRMIRSTSCLVIEWGFQGPRIERRYLRFEQIQDGGRRHLG